MLKPKKWYEDVYANALKNKTEYSKHYEQSIYYNVWKQAIQLIDSNATIFELGCGTGQFAHMMYDFGIKIHGAVDFSSVAINAAKKLLPKIASKFYVGDLLSKATYKLCKYNTIICFEVLEHIKEDLFVLKSISPGATVIFSLPSYPYQSHVRSFPDVADIYKRYEYTGILKINSHVKIDMDKNGEKYIWLLKGVKS